MASQVQLKDRVTKEPIYPITNVESVIGLGSVSKEILKAYQYEDSSLGNVRSNNADLISKVYSSDKKDCPIVYVYYNMGGVEISGILQIDECTSEEIYGYVADLVYDKIHYVNITEYNVLYDEADTLCFAPSIIFNWGDSFPDLTFGQDEYLRKALNKYGVGNVHIKYSGDFYTITHFIDNANYMSRAYSTSTIVYGSNGNYFVRFLSLEPGSDGIVCYNLSSKLSI